jgi:threonine dehydratase
MESLEIDAPEVTEADIAAAAARIRPLAKRTPVLCSEAFDEASGVKTVFKCENLQTGGAFKIRGAANAVLSIPAEKAGRGVVAFSSGNHAQAVAIAARYVGIPATIVMPADAPRSKLEATRSCGATVIAYDRRTESREAIAADVLERTGATLVPPFDHPLVIAGQGTAAAELLDDAPEIDALLAPISGGGLLAGCAIAAKARKPAIRIFGAEPVGANDTYLSFVSGKRVEVMPDTIADGLRVPSPGRLTFPVVRRLAEGILLVSDDEMRRAVKFLLLRLKILVEPSGAAAAAAVLFGRLPAGIGRAGVILSGGNVDFEDLAGY